MAQPRRSFSARSLKAAAFAVAVALSSTAARADDAEPLFRSTGEACYRIPALASLGDGRLIAVVEKRYGYPERVAAAAARGEAPAKAARCTDSGSIDLVARWSSDGGGTWGPERTIVDHRDLMAPPYTRAMAGNPTLVARGNDLLLIYVVNRSAGGENGVRCVRFRQDDRDRCGGQAAHGLYVSRSANGGADWGRPEEMAFVGRPSRVKHSGPGHGIVLNSGRIVVPAYPRLLLSDDGGRTWREGAGTQGNGEMQGGETVVGTPDGEQVWASLRPTGGAYRLRRTKSPYRIRAISVNGGESYRSLETDDQLGIPPVQPGFAIADKVQILSHPVSANASNGRARNDDRRNLTLSISRDAGESWRSCLLDPGGAGYSDIAPISDARFGVLFEGSLESGETYRAGVNFRRVSIDHSENICLKKD